MAMKGDGEGLVRLALPNLLEENVFSGEGMAVDGEDGVPRLEARRRRFGHGVGDGRAEESAEEGNAGAYLAVSQVLEGVCGAQIEVGRRQNSHEREEGTGCELTSAA